MSVVSISTAQAQLQLQPFVSGLAQPVGMVPHPSDPSIIFVVEQGGHIKVVQNGTILPQDFLDVSSLIVCCGERGLLGLAFAPDYSTSRRFFINYTNAQGHTVIARYQRSVGNPLVADPSTRFDLKWISLAGQAYIEQPYTNHNGGDLAFGTDGYLYIGMGDGGAGNDPLNYAQRADQLLGKMLRIDVNVNNANGYQIPADNPFVDNNPIPALPEIWDFGMRNPWRFSFDIGTGGTGALIIADVGQSAREEINYEPAGAGGRNYGWSIREGTLSNSMASTATPAFNPLTNPIYDYDRSLGQVIAGGHVYRGTAMGPSYRGRYFFADFGSQRVWSLGLNISGPGGEATVSSVIEHTAELGGTSAIGNVSTFGRDLNGELYLVNYGGSIMKIVDPAFQVRIQTTADFNADMHPDLLTQRAGGSVEIALGNGAGAFNTVQSIFSGSTSWRVVGTGRFNADSTPDIVWQSPTGAVVAWLMNPPAVLQAIYLYNGGTSWQVSAVADINRDGFSDLVWQSPTGEVAVWFMQGATLQGVQYVWNSVTPWRVVASSDFNGNGESDLVWQHPNGQAILWLMLGTSMASSRYFSTDTTSWRILGTGDVDGDGMPDVIWQGPSGQLVAWLMSNTTLSTFRYIRASGSGWVLSTSP